MDIAYPYDIAPEGTTATTDEDRHLRDLVEQLLFTSPGERVNRPELGSGLSQLVFEPNDEVLESIDVDSRESELRIQVVYRSRRDGRRRTESFAREV